MKFLLTCLTFILALSSSANAITSKQYAAAFKGYHACFILYDVNQQKIISQYGPHNRCNERIAPNSTFKVPLSLMAFDQDLINPTTVFKWDGEEKGMAEWNQNQTPASWLKYSAVWVSQQITPQLGAELIQDYLANFEYGNQNFTGDPGKNNGLQVAWLSSSLKISANEQLRFLNAMLTHQLLIKEAAFTHTKENMHLGQLNNGADYYGKTGAGRHGRNERETDPSLLRDGWFIGFIDKDDHHYIFVSNLTDKKPQVPVNGSLQPYGSQVLKPIVLELLNKYFA